MIKYIISNMPEEILTIYERKIRTKIVMKYIKNKQNIKALRYCHNCNTISGSLLNYHKIVKCASKYKNFHLILYIILSYTSYNEPEATESLFKFYTEKIVELNSYNRNRRAKTKIKYYDNIVKFKLLDLIKILY